MKKNGFTLAEVLITLVIIGVIAALTIPTLTKANNRSETEARLKQAYSIFANAIKLSIIDNGEVATWDYSDGSAFVTNYIAPYLKFSKVCSQSTPCDQYSWYKPNGAATEWKADGRSPNIYGGYLSNGMYFVTQPIGPGDSNMYNDYGYILFFVDINGQKGPNMIAKDIFWFSYFPNGQLSTVGLYSDNAASWKNYASLCQNISTNALVICTAWIMSNGWKIPDDYPWL